MRVLTTWLRWGVLYRFPMGINSFHLPPFCGRFFKYFLVGFSSGTSRIAGFGEGTPQQDLPKGQNRRYADFGTVVESCSKKSTLRLGVLFAQFLLLCPTTDNLQFCQTERQTFFNAAHFRRNGRKKSSKPFSDLLLLCAAVMGGGYSVVFAYFSSVNWELSLQGLFFSK